MTKSTKEAMYLTAERMEGVFTAEEFADRMKREFPRLALSRYEVGVRLCRTPYIETLPFIPKITMLGDTSRVRTYRFKGGRQ